MKIVLQRVLEAQVEADGVKTGEIGSNLTGYFVRRAAK